MTTRSSARRPLRVLVADDNPLNLRLATRILREMGHSGMLVSDGHKVLEALQAQTFDLVLMDVTMPGMDGVEALRAWRAREAALGARRTPVIMVTAYDLPEDRRRLLEAGADGYVAKPLEPERLAAEIQRVLG
ncbi:Signal transduction histidine-protein kinase BarA [Tepidimonas alkaliphilus]|uniref:Signal transduction histidine-protein kinase BarA n=1 Tax=Tepidimonas alkaliphilus TaxID=2588942 RepID=A0A554W735_9BURK|nr:response regulator [Tepidimonas alkaliphilus]TSE19391.1 Signal transduction histidine-protein kinase BarA [Tepidimonas alkaliphilus]